MKVAASTTTAPSTSNADKASLDQQLEQAKRDWWAANATHDQAAMDAAHAKADALRKNGASVDAAAEQKINDQGQKDASLTQAKTDYWQAKATGDTVAMAKAHDTADQLRKAGANENSAVNQSINAQGAKTAALADTKRDYWAANATGDQAAMDAAHATADELRKQGATMDAATEQKVNDQGQKDSALAQVKAVYWQANAIGDQATMAKAHETADKLRQAGAKEDSAVNQRINNQGAKTVALVGAKEDYWVAKANGDQAGMDAAHAKADDLRANGATVNSRIANAVDQAGQAYVTNVAKARAEAEAAAVRQAEAERAAAAQQPTAGQSDGYIDAGTMRATSAPNHDGLVDADGNDEWAAASATSTPAQTTAWSKIKGEATALKNGVVAAVNSKTGRAVLGAVEAVGGTLEAIAGEGLTDTGLGAVIGVPMMIDGGAHVISGVKNTYDAVTNDTKDYGHNNPVENLAIAISPEHGAQVYQTVSVTLNLAPGVAAVGPKLIDKAAELTQSAVQAAKPTLQILSDETGAIRLPGGDAAVPEPSGTGAAQAGKASTASAETATAKSVATAEGTGNGIKWVTNNEGLPEGGKITGYTDHGAEQALGRDGGRGVSNGAIQETATNPKKVVEQPPSKPGYGPTYKYVGQDAVIVLNDDGQVVTAYAKGSQGLRRVK